MVVAENKNLVVVGGWGVESTGGNFFRWGNEQVLTRGGTPPARKTLSIVVLLLNWYLQHSRIYFSYSFETEVWLKPRNQAIELLKIQQNTFLNKILCFLMSNGFCKLIRTILLWPFVLYPTRCTWLWLKIE